MPLKETIIQAIREKGPLSFHDFMEMALYHPGEGYHSCCRTAHTLNNAGNNPDTCSLIAHLLARQLEEMWKLLDKTTFTIVEYGVGPGMPGSDLFQYFSHHPDLQQKLHYCIIGKNEAVNQWAQPVCAQAEWFDSIEEVPYEPDCIVSKEVVNNFAVHEVVMQKELMEVFVDYQKGFVEILKPAPKELNEYLAEMQVSLPRGYRTEINMDALQWLRRNAAALQKGFLLTIGNGLPAHEYFSLSRHRGNLVCEDERPATEILYETIGEKDIRSTVNFTALHHWGRRFGLECCGFTSQAHFLHGLGLLSALDKIHEDAKDRMVQLYRSIMKVSNRFNILVQQKGLSDPQLSGLQFAKNYV